MSSDLITPEMLQLVEAEMERLERLEKIKVCFDSANLNSRPTVAQDAIFRAINSQARYRICCGGNQCLAEGTPVLTPTGVVPIEFIKPGDTVYNEYGNPIKVLSVFDNGVKDVRELVHRESAWVEATDSHVFLTGNSTHKNSGHKQKRVGDFTRDTQIIRMRVKAPLGNKHVAEAYALGALLGDGCSREKSKKHIAISSEDDIIPLKVGKILNMKELKRNSLSNYTWQLRDCERPELYSKWCEGRYAHEKLVDLEEVKTWDRESILNLFAGLIDTDGCVRLDKWNTVTIACSMQALTAIQFLQWAFLTLWQIPVNIKTTTEGYVNGPIYEVKVANNIDSMIALQELDPYLVLSRKKWKPEYNDLVARRTTNDVGVKLGTTRSCNTHDIHVDSSTNLYMLANGMITHNSGKSSISIRDLVWVLEGTHPYWERPINHVCNNKSCRNADTERIGDITVPRYRCHKCGNIWEPWGKTEALNIILCGENRMNLFQNLWLPRIKPLLSEPDKWKEVKVGNMIAWAEHRETGDKIMFFPHSKGEEQSRKAVQGFTIHFVYMDELAPVSVMEELMRRVDAKLGWFTAAFTMKKVDPEMLKFLQKQEESGTAQRFKLSKLDNPKYTGMKDVILAQLAGLTPEQKEAYLYGEMGESDDRVFVLDGGKVKRPLPQAYSRSWRHTLIVDPAIQSKAGFLLLAQEPGTNIWYVAEAKYLTGMQDPAELLDFVETHTYGYNIIKKISDNQAWFTGTAKRRGHDFKTPPNKQKRDGKVYIIKKAQMFLASGGICIPEVHEDLWYELESYRWDDSGKHIVNSNKYHIIDCLVYFVDCLPRNELETVTAGLSYDEKIYALNRAAAGRTEFEKQKILQNRENTIKMLRGPAASMYLKKLGLNTITGRRR